MSKNDTGTQTSTTKSEPWSGQIPYLTSGFGAAGQLYNQGGPQYYPGQTYAGPTDQQLQGVGTQAALGANGTPVQGAANNATTSYLDPSFLTANPSGGSYANANGGLSVDTGAFAPIASGQVQNLGGVGPLSGIASGQIRNTGGQDTLSQIAGNGGGSVPGMDTLTKFSNGDMLSADNPYFQTMANKIRAQVQPAIEGQFAQGNRLDGGLASRALGEGLGDSIGALAYNNYQQGLGQQESAANSLANIGQQNTSNRLNAAGMQGQLGANNLGQQASAAGQLSNIGQSNIQNMLAGSTGIANTGFGNAGNILAGASGLSNNFNNSTQRQLTASALAPQLSAMDFGNALQLQQAGESLQGLQQGGINDQVQRYNYNQQLPYQNLQNYLNMISGNYGGTKTQTDPYAKNTAGNVLGGALGGSAALGSILGPTGLSLMSTAGGAEGLGGLLGAGLALI